MTGSRDRDTRSVKTWVDGWRVNVLSSWRSGKTPGSQQISKLQDVEYSLIHHTTTFACQTSSVQFKAMSRSTEESNLPWPECLGTFDEESCRFFLRELGQRVVQFYPFSVGIEEVYTSIVDKYGYSGACDAISVLQELLEDDTTADGVGDDGDIWRSWRWSWRHRNVSISIKVKSI